ncbi:phosphatase [Clostridium sp. AWRP]|uniref:phosphatase n=1 Tax=Clostridium sp. AWRP TaxID=2212991 RepID=UPI000FDA1A43|nr:phosphatase [Clostridium sp. AWRP]AZV57536.1 PHP domain-containing protein [Clostridium sp. AWRP]
MKALMDLHVHTISSGHAFSTLKENIEEAKLKGLKVLGISDHARAMEGTAHPFYFGNLSIINEKIMGIRILKGIEANIINFQGNIDVNQELASKLDYVIASLHPPCIKAGTVEENTKSIIRAMDNPYVKIIGHPDDNRFLLDYEKVVLAAKEKNILLEMNNSSLSSRSQRENSVENQKKYLNLCKKYEAKIILGSDAHIYYDVGEFTNCFNLLKNVEFPEELIFNSNTDSLKWLLEKK